MTSTEINNVLILAIIIPILLVAIIYQIILFIIKSKEEKLQWKFKNEIFFFIKFLLYNSILFGLWIISIPILGVNSNVDRSQFSVNSLFILIVGNYVPYLIYIITYALVWSYGSFFINKIFKQKVDKPNFITIAKLFFWNISVFMLSSGILFIVASFLYSRTQLAI